jgi:hypothetical protein
MKKNFDDEKEKFGKGRILFTKIGNYSAEIRMV